MSKKLDEVESRVKEFCLYLERNYPKEYQGSAEYTRLWRTLEAFLQWGCWSKHEEEEHDLIEVKPKIIIERWFNVVQSPDYGLYIEQYSTKDAAIAARQVHGDTIITKAIPFVWREP